MEQVIGVPNLNTSVLTVEQKDIAASDHYTEIRPLYRNPATKQASDHYTGIPKLHRNPATIQKSSHYTEIQPLGFRV